MLGLSATPIVFMSSTACAIVTPSFNRAYTSR
jgi:hypothetical protein